MTTDEFVETLQIFSQIGLVKARRRDGNAFFLELWSEFKRRERTQIIQVNLIEDDSIVFACSTIGVFPDDPNVIKAIFRRTAHNFYSRIGFIDGKLMQVFVHSLAKMDEERLTEAIYEVAHMADALEEEFFKADQY